MFLPCYSSSDTTPLLTPSSSPPTSPSECGSAKPAMEVNLENGGSQPSTGISYKVMPDKGNFQPTECSRAPRVVVSGCDLTGYLPQTVESLAPFQRFLRESERQNRIPALVRYNIPSNDAVASFTEITRGSQKRTARRNRKGAKRRSRTTRASSVHVEAVSEG